MTDRQDPNDRRGFVVRAAQLAMLAAVIQALATQNIMSAPLHLPAGSQMVEITAADGVSIDLRYATTQNFTGRNIYGSARQLYLHPIAADKLRQAVAILKATHPTYRIVIFDGLRLNSAQKTLWDVVRGTDKARYVADPLKGSIHGFGLAVDLSLLDEAGHELDMGTPFDDFTLLAQPRLEARFAASGKLTPLQLANRRVLRRIMQQAGFLPLALEWWHFDALPPDYVRRHYRRMD